ncbi:hypothetical protein RHOFW510R12_07905 [Rhodanobacter sp. FW510-R12]|nr:hypothetical protein RHOFW104R8_05625 [Rhodanobacter sp. FW104-R8]KZC27769.1 hypothetical protein RhoFW510T8_14725 [Rhodanobacter sp. FW510-T8]KZC29467.1 hypothetical protein RhoFW510R10_05640 [Rhodanobacter sp. FW510-R10]
MATDSTQRRDALAYQRLQWATSLDFHALNAAPIIVTQQGERIEQQVNALVGMPSPEKQQPIRRLRTRRWRITQIHTACAGKKGDRDTCNTSGVLRQLVTIGIGIYRLPHDTR